MAQTNRLTKQGVPSLDPVGRNGRHDHKYLPEVVTGLGGYQTTEMRCFCGDVLQESSAEKTTRKVVREEHRIAVLETEARKRGGWAD